MPYPNEHACRLRDPGDFTRFISQSRTATGPGAAAGKTYRAIVGVLRRTGKFADQAYRYARRTWTAAVARSHCRAHEGKLFEPATGAAAGLDDVVQMPDGTVMPVEKATEEDLRALKEQEQQTADAAKAAEQQAKATRCPRNPYGSQGSYEFKGGMAGYRNAWRKHFSQLTGGNIEGEATAPIRGTVRRATMIAATIRASAGSTPEETIAPRTGPRSPLSGGYPATPKDYGLKEWKKESDAEEQHRATALSAEDVNAIKRAGVAELKRRIAEREREQKRGATAEEEEFFAWVAESEDLIGRKRIVLHREAPSPHPTAPAPDEGREEIQNRLSFPIAKLRPKQRKAMGIVSAPMKPDAHGHYMTAEEIEKAADYFMINHRRVDEQHDMVHGIASVTQSFIARAGDRDFPEGAWVAEVKFHDEGVWKKVMKGEYKAFSFAGSARRGKTREMESEWVDDDGNFRNPYHPEGEEE